MKLQKIIYCLLFSLILHSANGQTSDKFPTAKSSEAKSAADTIRLNPLPPKPTKTYPLQPIILKTSPVAILWGPIPLTAEYRLVVEMPSSKNQAMQFGISYLGKSPIWSIVEQGTRGGVHPVDFVINGVSIQVANKFYLVQKRYGSPFGFYIAPQVCYSNAHISISKGRAYRKTYIDATQFSATMLGGVQIGRRKKFTADVFGGLGYKKNTWIYHATTYRTGPFDTSDFGNFFNSNVKVTFGLNLGWAIY